MLRLKLRQTFRTRQPPLALRALRLAPRFPQEMAVLLSRFPAQPMPAPARQLWDPAGMPRVPVAPAPEVFPRLTYRPVEKPVPPCPVWFPVATVPSTGQQGGVFQDLPSRVAPRSESSIPGSPDEP